MTIRFDGRVAIVTGAGNGLGRAHALGLASRGAKVVVNDFGGARDGTGGSLTPAETVVEEIRKAGGTAMADGADVSNYEQVKAMVERATKEWGSVDLLCANAGILRDKSFAKMEIADFAKVLDVHLTGTLLLLQGGVGRHARAQLRPHRAHHLVVRPVRQFRPGQLRRGEIRHGRPDERAGRGGPQEQHPRQHHLADGGDPDDRGIAAAAGARADAAGGDHARRWNICCSEDAPTRTIMGAGAGSFAVIKIMETEGINLAQSDWTPDAIAAHFAEISDMSKAKALQGAFEQTQKYVGQAAARAGIKL